MTAEIHPGTGPFSRDAGLISSARKTMTDQTATQPQIREVSVTDALRLAEAGYRIIDVREELEWNDGHIPSATLLPLGAVLDRIEAVVPDKTTPLLVHCAAGARCWNDW